MGLEFIRKTRTPHRKSWAAEFQEGTTDLIAQIPLPVNETYLANCNALARLRPGTQLIARMHESCAVLVQGEAVIGAFGEMPSILSNGASNAIAVAVEVTSVNEDCTRAEVRFLK